MSEFKKQQLRDEYNVKKKYIIPSVYGRVDERRTVERELLKNENFS